MNQDCEFTPKCPIFNKFRREKVRSFWIKRYCSAEFGKDCARKKLRDSGKGMDDIPNSLLPNGMNFPEFESFDQMWESKTKDTCEYLEYCSPMFDRFIDFDSKDFWAQRHCFEKDGNYCKRKTLFDDGARAESIPNDLLPNGEKF